MNWSNYLKGDFWLLYIFHDALMFTMNSGVFNIYF
jgi:hypothetical protein